MVVFQSLLFVATIIAGAAFAVTVVLLVLDVVGEQQRFRKSRDLKLFRVMMPRLGSKQEEREQQGQQNQRELISVVEQFLASIASIAREKKRVLKNIDHITVEILAQHNEVHFYISIPQSIADLAQKQLHAVYSDAVIEPAEEFNMYLPKIGYAHAAHFGYKKEAAWPLRTYQHLESDPLNVITNTISKIGKDEAALVQICFRPAGDALAKKGDALAKKIQDGKVKLAGKSLKSAFEGVLKTKKPGEADQPKQLTPLVEEAIKAIEAKASKTSFEVNLRVAAGAASKEAAQVQVRNMIAAFDQFSFPGLNKLVPVQPKNNQELGSLLTSIIFRTFEPRRSLLMSTEELGSFTHLPDSRLVTTPSIVWLGARTAPAPAQLPTEGRLIGYNVYRGERRPFLLPRDDRRKHFYLVGKTGTGKTTLMINKIREDIEAGEGVAYLDPHGDAIEQILQSIPKHRIDDVIVFRPGDVERPMGLNMLEYESEELKDFVVGEMIAIFYKLFPPEIIGPMFEHNMRNVMLTLMEDEENPGTIAEIPRMFSDERFQRAKVAKVKDAVVRSFWENEMAKTSDFHKSEMLGYLISKVGRFVENKLMRNIIGQQKSAFNFRDIMDNKKIFLANLSKGEIGDINANLIGMILVTKLQMAALSRVNVPEKERQDFYLYIDEFQNFTTDSIPTILSEARKYRLNLILAHQFISQIDEEIRDAVFGNVGSIMSYRVGPQDADILEKEFEPTFNANDVSNLGFAQAYVKTTVNRETLPAFSLEVPAPWEVSEPERVRAKVGESLKQLSRLTHGRDRAVVEREIEDRGKIKTPEKTL